MAHSEYCAESFLIERQKKRAVIYALRSLHFIENNKNIYIIIIKNYNNNKKMKKIMEIYQNIGNYYILLINMK